jgi:hypothetical protein
MIEYTIKLLMVNKQDISDSALQQATMTVLVHQIYDDFGSEDICILDGTGNQMCDFKLQAILTFRSWFHVGQNKGNSK